MKCSPDWAAECARRDRKIDPKGDSISQSAAQTAAQTHPQNAPKHPGTPRNPYLTTTYAKLGRFVIDRSSVQVRSSAPFFQQFTDNQFTIRCTTAAFLPVSCRIGNGEKSKMREDRGTASPAANYLRLHLHEGVTWTFKTYCRSLRQNSAASAMPSLHSKDSSRPHLAVAGRPSRKQPLLLPARNDVR